MSNSTAEKLALMTSKGIQIGHIPGGKGALTAQDIAGALGMAGLDRGPYLLMLAKYCGDAEVLSELYLQAWFAAADMAVRHRWKVVRGKPYFKTMARIAVDEVIEANRCMRCRGTGENEAKKDCPRCSGSGAEPRIGGDTMAELLEMPRSTWYSTWEYRFTCILGEIRYWETNALDQLRDTLARDHD